MGADNNAQYFDSLPVTEYTGAIRGKFDLPAELGETIRHEDVLTFLVVVEAREAKMKTQKTGDLLRENVFQVNSVEYIDPTITQPIVDLIRNGTFAEADDDE